MDDDVISQVIILILLILFSAILSASEAAFVNFNKSRLKNISGNGNKNLVLELDDNYENLMSTILITGTILKITAVSLEIYILSNYLSVFSATLVAVLTILFIVEIPAKGLAKFSPEKHAVFLAPILKLLVFLCTPVNFTLTSLKSVFYKILKTEIQPFMTEDELITMIDEVENEGVINKNESDLIRSAIEFSETVVEDIYTPRIDIVGIDEDESLEEIREKFLISGYSRLPVFQGDMDNIVGVLHEKDFYQALNRKEKDIRKLVSKILYVTPNKKISELLKELQLSKAHMAVVIDEYGGTEGLVTMEDIIEELVGEIWDEHDEVFEWFKKIGEDKFLISCNADIDDMFELFGIEPDEELDVTTVNGWITMLFEEIPEAGGRIVYKDLDITVTKAEAKRVLEIQVEKIDNELNLTK
ncbi:HlyC/CorC family transporter [Sedimentibacter hydroxybenzoicus DSM 7310]|uniref:HlyC/CorC family transporter n=1 Tax=Sedimentibacter hydroxybenzoicus DSM 7310 TaxID=1123245 RepID=A0A974BM75_SEDHY|nr:hemolysin family protein [Sedimentibacter hydroxybenzoicus]NYB75738.1 HlyC/CorC family transporter [Sedimentibacter hydroxybenzoicus DSM 7310]